MKNYEIEGFRYENFLKRFYKFDLRLRRPHKSEFIQLIELENSDHSTFHSKMNEIKDRLNKALHIFEEMEVLKTKSSSNLTPVLFAMVGNAKTVAHLNKFLEFALNQTADYQ